MRRNARSFAFFVVLLGFTAALPAASTENLQDVLAQTLPAKAAQALAAIPESGRKLLAARSYFRSHATLDVRWSWSEAQIKAYEGSAEQERLLADIARINEHFGGANPGYSLYTNTEVRSLEKQTEAWNENPSVGTAAAELLMAFESDAALDLRPDNPNRYAQLKAWLSARTPQQGPNLAAPGLSAHGQMRAIDFQIVQGARIIAAADSAEVENIWRAQGWDAKLKASISAAGPAFEGPLTSPDEPWHYSYSPEHEVTGHVEIST